MKCAIMQPTYIPWLGYLDLADQVDHFVLLDDVKLEKGSWHVRNRIKTAQGELYLTLPIRRTKSRLEMLITEAEINHQEKWLPKHLKSIFYAYQKTPFFEDVYPWLEKLLGSGEELLSEFNVGVIESLCAYLGIDTKIHRSSRLASKDGVKEERLIAICSELGCDEYISPQGSAVYINEQSIGGKFVGSPVALRYMNYRHPLYPQPHGEFLPYMSVIDLLFNVGSGSALGTIRSGRLPTLEYSMVGLPPNP